MRPGPVGAGGLGDDAMCGTPPRGVRARHIPSYIHGHFRRVPGACFLSLKLLPMGAARREVLLPLECEGRELDAGQARLQPSKWSCPSCGADGAIGPRRG